MSLLSERSVFSARCHSSPANRQWPATHASTRRPRLPPLPPMIDSDAGIAAPISGAGPAAAAAVAGAAAARSGAVVGTVAQKCAARTEYVTAPAHSQTVCKGY